MPSFWSPSARRLLRCTPPAPYPPHSRSLRAGTRRSTFSAAELRNDIRHLEAAYAEFDLASSDFSQAAIFVRQLSELAKDEYWITVSLARSDAIADECSLSPTLKRAFVHRGATYVANASNFAPFVAISGELRTTVTLLSRFLYYWKNVCLTESGRFQIRSGFIFEQTAAAALARQRFTLTGIKRLNRKEFDVVAVRDGVIFNIQCKNNLVDLSRLEADVAFFVRYNRARVRSYERALRKEAGREALLDHRTGARPDRTFCRHAVSPSPLPTPELFRLAGSTILTR